MTIDQHLSRIPLIEATTEKKMQLNHSRRRAPISLLLWVAASTLASTAASAAINTSTLPEAIPSVLQVPADNSVAWRATASGTVDYECQMLQTDGTMPAWIAVKTRATLAGTGSTQGGTYTSPPETWRAADGSAVTGMEVLRANTHAGRLYDQLVLANPASGVGLLTGISYIQRVVASGGAAPEEPCTGARMGQRQASPFQAQYFFWKPN
ncbi:DUF3455 domain-containing protein [Achromobacter aegrifaciens]|uniref:DUF3455 domain-containing protein n=1 Tax=Achromobacter aegrifaciens TaxID=1287736 RepID=UPI0027BA689E|nr:DUF3455 domain-containing protein [Achromobacter aegrifaciens]WLW63577.1 DUF3455 domain-containing protein [Achromobacter aegrifaciens]